LGFFNVIVFIKYVRHCNETHIPTSSQLELFVREHSAR